MSVLSKPEVVYNDRGRLVERRACAFCWATFTQKRSTQYHCSPECSKRDSAWDGWVRDTRSAAVSGDVRKPAKLGAALPPAGAGMAVSVERFRVPLSECCAPDMCPVCVDEGGHFHADGPWAPALFELEAVAA